MSYTEKLFNLEGKVVLITGGAGFLGSHYAEGFAQSGALPIIADTDGEKTKALAKELSNKYGVRVEGLELDVTSPESIKNCVDAIVRMFGRIDVLINNAGISGKVANKTVAPDFESYPKSEWEKAFAVNIEGMVLCCQEVGKVMKKQGRGVVINVSSMYGVVSPDQRIYETGDPSVPPFIKPAAYGASKAAVINLTKYLSTYWAKNNIRVNAITPGGIFNGENPDFVKKYGEKCPLGRMARAEEMVGPILFLAGDTSSYMTGANLIVDGGWTAW